MRTHEQLWQAAAGVMHFGRDLGLAGDVTGPQSNSSGGCGSRWRGPHAVSSWKTLAPRDARQQHAATAVPVSAAESGNNSSRQHDVIVHQPLQQQLWEQQWLPVSFQAPASC